jgi:hypothetical protein
MNRASLKRARKPVLAVCLGIVLYLIATNAGAGWLYVISAAIGGVVLVSAALPWWNAQHQDLPQGPRRRQGGRSLRVQAGGEEHRLAGTAPSGDRGPLRQGYGPRGADAGHPRGTGDRALHGRGPAPGRLLGRGRGGGVGGAVRAVLPAHAGAGSVGVGGVPADVRRGGVAAVGLAGRRARGPERGPDAAPRPRRGVLGHTGIPPRRPGAPHRLEEERAWYGVGQARGPGARPRRRTRPSRSR